MKNLTIFPLICVLVTSCASTSWMEKDYENQTGIITYPDQGLDYFNNKNREEALNEISAFCQDGYKIVKETNKSVHTGKSYSEEGTTKNSSKDSKSSEGTYKSSGRETETYSNVVYLHFKCKTNKGNI